MKDYQREFLEFALDVEVLRFGEFVLKSGRHSPYFFNAGLFNTGARLAQLGRYYAQTIVDSAIEFDMLYGPAYKGIPLVAGTCVALADHHRRDVPYAFNRKEAKDHGEGGSIVGSALRGRVLIVDDVISAGTSVRESVDVIHAHGAEPAGVIIALDRQEQGQDNRSAVSQVETDVGIPVVAIARLGGCRVMGDRSEGVGERGRFSPYSRRIVDLCNENTGKIGPPSHIRSRFSHNPTAS